MAKPALPHPLKVGAPLPKDPIQQAQPHLKTQKTLLEVAVVTRRTTYRIARGIRATKRSKAMSLSAFGFAPMLQVKTLLGPKESGW